MTAMNAVTGEVDMAERMSAMLDRAEIAELVDRYIHLLDSADDPERDDEAYRRVFTDDVRLTFPIGQRQGIAGLAQFQRSAYLCWERTYHQSGNHVIDLDGDLARVRAQVWALHVEGGAEPMGVSDAHRFDVGGSYDATAVRSGTGWRIAALEFIVLWTSGGGRPAADYSPALLVDGEPSSR
jgi:hypothetical protein